MKDFELATRQCETGGGNRWEEQSGVTRLGEWAVQIVMTANKQNYVPQSVSHITLCLVFRLIIFPSQDACHYV